MGVVLSLKEISNMYLHFFGKPIHAYMTYEEAMRDLVKEVGVPELLKRQKLESNK